MLTRLDISKLKALEPVEPIRATSGSIPPSSFTSTSRSSAASTSSDTALPTTHTQGSDGQRVRKYTHWYTHFSLDIIEDCVYNVYMKSRVIIRKLEKAGWVEVRQAGSHKQFRHPHRKGTVTVPHPDSNMALGTIKSIEKQSGVKLR
jgi:predicted RNA binding protein YcfA (HicA-like mRNA interferase family)